LVDHEWLLLYQFNNLYLLFVEGKTNTHMSVFLVTQLGAFLIQFEEETMCIHHLVMKCALMVLIFFKYTVTDDTFGYTTTNVIGFAYFIKLI